MRQLTGQTVTLACLGGVLIGLGVGVSAATLVTITNAPLASFTAPGPEFPPEFHLAVIGLGLVALGAHAVVEAWRDVQTAKSRGLDQK